MASDIKIIEDMIDYHPTVTIAKGQTHFLCKKRFDEFFLDKEKPGRNIQKFMKMLKEMATRGPTGMQTYRIFYGIR